MRLTDKKLVLRVNFVVNLFMRFKRFIYLKMKIYEYENKINVNIGL